MRTSGAIFCLLIFGSFPLLAQQPSAFTKPGQQDRYQRLKMLATVIVDWHCHVAGADAQQRAKLSGDLDARAIEQARQASFREENYTIAAFASTRPNAGRVLTEGRAWKPGPSGWQKTLRSTLTRQQHETLAATLVRRRVGLVDSAAAAHAAYVQHLVGLSSEAGPTLQKHLVNQFGTDLLSQPLCIRTLPRFRLLDDTVVSQMLAGRGEGLRKVLRGNAIDGAIEYRVSLTVWVKSGSDEKKEAAINSAFDDAMKRAESSHMSTVVVLGNRYKLSAGQQRKLALAAKGVRARCASKWRRELSEQYDSNAALWGRAIAGFESSKISRTVALRVPALRDDRIWTRALAKLALDSATLNGRSEFIRRGLVQQQLVIFEGELWLRQDQRPAFEKLLDSTIRNDPPAKSIEQLSAQVTATAKLLPDEAVNKLLTPNQLRVLHFLREPKPIR